MEDYLKGLIQALHVKLGTFIGHVTELEMGIQVREQELKRLYEAYEPHRLQQPETDKPAKTPDVSPTVKGK